MLMHATASVRRHLSSLSSVSSRTLRCTLVAHACLHSTRCVASSASAASSSSAAATADANSGTTTTRSSVQQHAVSTATLPTMPTFHPQRFRYDKMLSLRTRTLSTYKERCRALQRRWAALQQRIAAQTTATTTIATTTTTATAATTAAANTTSCSSTPLQLLPPTLADELDRINRKTEALYSCDCFVLSDAVVYSTMHHNVCCGAYDEAIRTWLLPRVVRERRGPPYPARLLRDMTHMLRAHVLVLLPSCTATLTHDDAALCADAYVVLCAHAPQSGSDVAVRQARRLLRLPDSSTITTAHENDDNNNNDDDDDNNVDDDDDDDDEHVLSALSARQHNDDDAVDLGATCATTANGSISADAAEATDAALHALLQPSYNVYTRYLLCRYYLPLLQASRELRLFLVDLAAARVTTEEDEDDDDDNSDNNDDVDNEDSESTPMTTNTTRDVRRDVLALSSEAHTRAVHTLLCSFTHRHSLVRAANDDDNNNSNNSSDDDEGGDSVLQLVLSHYAALVQCAAEARELQLLLALHTAFCTAFVTLPRTSANNNNNNNKRNNDDSNECMSGDSAMYARLNTATWCSAAAEAHDDGGGGEGGDCTRRRGVRCVVYADAQRRVRRFAAEHIATVYYVRELVQAERQLWALYRVQQLLTAAATVASATTAAAPAVANTQDTLHAVADDAHLDVAMDSDLVRALRRRLRPLLATLASPAAHTHGPAASLWCSTDACTRDVLCTELMTRRQQQQQQEEHDAVQQQRSHAIRASSDVNEADEDVMTAALCEALLCFASATNDEALLTLYEQQQQQQQQHSATATYMSSHQLALMRELLTCRRGCAALLHRDDGDDDEQRVHSEHVVAEAAEDAVAAALRGPQWSSWSVYLSTATAAAAAAAAADVDDSAHGDGRVRALHDVQHVRQLVDGMVGIVVVHRMAALLQLLRSSVTTRSATTTTRATTTTASHTSTRGDDEDNNDDDDDDSNTTVEDDEATATLTDAPVAAAAAEGVGDDSADTDVNDDDDDISVSASVDAADDDDNGNGHAQQQQQQPQQAQQQQRVHDGDSSAAAQCYAAVLRQWRVYTADTDDKQTAAVSDATADAVRDDADADDAMSSRGWLHDTARCVERLLALVQAHEQQLQAQRQQQQHEEGADAVRTRAMSCVCMTPYSLASLALLLGGGGVAGANDSNSSYNNNGDDDDATLHARLLCRLADVAVCVAATCASSSSSSPSAQQHVELTYGNAMCYVLLMLARASQWRACLRVVVAMDGLVVERDAHTRATSVMSSSTNCCNNNNNSNNSNNNSSSSSDSCAGSMNSATMEARVFAEVYRRARAAGAAVLCAELRSRREQLFF